MWKTLLFFWLHDWLLFSIGLWLLQLLPPVPPRDIIPFHLDSASRRCLVGLNLETSHSEDTYLCFSLSCKLEWPHVLSDLQSTTVLDEVINERGGGKKFSQHMINSNWEAAAKKIHPLLSFSCWYTGVKMQLNWISCGVIIQLCLVGWTLMHSWNFCFLVQSHHVELSIKTCKGLPKSFCS